MAKKDTDTLGDRMKSYEELSTSRMLMPNTPVYARIDGRAFHTLCRGLKKPYSEEFIETMQETCKHLVKESGAILGYVQSDEISLGWEDSTKAPFMGRIQKLESVLASMASARFVQVVYERNMNSDVKSELYQRVIAHLPTFDCRIFNVPSLAELANCFLWRENDAIKNSITGMALSFYSHSQIQGKSGNEKILMMAEKGYNFYKDTSPSFMRGTFFHRELYKKKLSSIEVERIPESKRAGQLEVEIIRHPDTEEIEETNYYAVRSRIAPMALPWRLTDTLEVQKVLFNGEQPWCNKESPTFTIATF